MIPELTAELVLSVLALIVSALAAILTYRVKAISNSLQKRQVEAQEQHLENLWFNARTDYVQALDEVYRILGQRWLQFRSDRTDCPPALKDAVEQASWPQVELDQDPSLWRETIGNKIDVGGNRLYAFLERVYPRTEDHDPRPKSCLEAEAYDSFHKSRKIMSRYLERCGDSVERWPSFEQYFMSKHRGEHRRHVKLAMYAELALHAALKTSALKIGLFQLGRREGLDN